MRQGNHSLPGGNHMASYESSMIYTMGMALSRALESNAEVGVLVEGQWLTGRVVISDGYGVVLDNDVEHCVVKVENVAAVRILSAAPNRSRITDGEPADWAEPMPMPGPRMASA